MHRHALATLTGILAPLLGTLTAEAAEPLLALEQVATMPNPVFVTCAPGDHERLFVVDQRGIIWIIKDDVLLDEPFVDIRDDVDSSGGHMGLLGLAFHPDYQTNGLFYVNFVLDEPDGGISVGRLQVTADPDVADPESLQLVLRTSDNIGHRGGWIDFSPDDGYLWILKGDDGPTVPTLAQETDSLLGKLLRIDVDGDDFPADPLRNYAIPADNPYVGEAGLDEIYAIGLRQPWRGSFDRDTGDLYIGDVGHLDFEEISYLPASYGGGANFGWPCMEGDECTGSSACECDDPSLIPPLFAYPRPEPDFGACVIGGHLYRGSAIPALRGAYIFADLYVFVGGKIWLLRHEAGKVTTVLEIQDQLTAGGAVPLERPTSFGEDADGEIYICDRLGAIFKIVAACPWDVDGNGSVGFTDALSVLSAWGDDPGGPPDFDGDGVVGFSDLLLLLSAWGPCE